MIDLTQFDVMYSNTRALLVDDEKSEQRLEGNDWVFESVDETKYQREALPDGSIKVKDVVTQAIYRQFVRERILVPASETMTSVPPSQFS